MEEKDRRAIYRACDNKQIRKPWGRSGMVHHVMIDETVVADHRQPDGCNVPLGDKRLLGAGFAGRAA